MTVTTSSTVQDSPPPCCPTLLRCFTEPLGPSLIPAIFIKPAVWQYFGKITGKLVWLYIGGKARFFQSCPYCSHFLCPSLQGGILRKPPPLVRRCVWSPWEGVFGHHGNLRKHPQKNPSFGVEGVSGHHRRVCVVTMGTWGGILRKPPPLVRRVVWSPWELGDKVNTGNTTL